MTRTMPDISKDLIDGSEVVSVYSWRVNNSNKSLETIRSIQSALQKTEGDLRGYGYNAIYVDLTTTHHFVVIPYKNFTPA